MGLVSVYRFSEIARELEIFDSAEVRKMAIKLVSEKQIEEGEGLVVEDLLLMAVNSEEQEEPKQEELEEEVSN